MVVWMLPDEAAAFGRELARRLDGSARWRAVAPGLERGEEHELLGEVLPPAGGGHALLQLVHGGPIIQYSGSRLREAEVLGHQGLATVLVSGEVAFRWVPSEVDARRRAEFESLAATVWTTLREHSAPHVDRADGRNYRGARIGRETERVVQERDIVLQSQSAPYERLALRRRKDGR